MTTAKIGHTGEAVAAKYYMQRGFRLLTHNYHTRHGELDVVVQKDDLIIICEVKTRAGKQLGAPCEAVTPAKQRKILLASRQFLQQYELFEHCIRFDVVEVIPDAGRWKIHCIPNAFCDREISWGKHGF